MRRLVTEGSTNVQFLQSILDCYSNDDPVLEITGWRWYHDDSCVREDCI